MKISRILRELDIWPSYESSSGRLKLYNSATLNLVEQRLQKTREEQLNLPLDEDHRDPCAR